MDVVLAKYFLDPNDPSMLSDIGKTYSRDEKKLNRLYHRSIPNISQYNFGLG